MPDDWPRRHSYGVSVDATLATTDTERPTVGGFECDVKRIEAGSARTRLRAGVAVGAAMIIVAIGALGAPSHGPAAPAPCPEASASATLADTPTHAAGQRPLALLLPRDGDVIRGRDVPIAAIVSLGRSLADSDEGRVLVTIRAGGVVLGSAEVPVHSSIVVGTITIQPPARGTIAELTMSRPGSTVQTETVRIVVASKP